MRKLALTVLGMLLPLAALPAPGGAAPVVPPGADPQATLFIGPAGVDRAGIFGRELGTDNRLGPWALLATDDEAPYEFALTEARNVDGRTSLGVRPAGGSSIESACPGKRYWETTEDTNDQSVEFQNVNNAAEHASLDFRFKFRELYCEGGTAGFVESWFRTSEPTQEVFIKAFILNQDKNADTAIPFEYYVKGRVGREGTPQFWRRAPDWGLPYWFKALFKSMWKEYDSQQPDHTAIDNEQWPPGDGLFSVGYHCPQYGPDPVPACYDMRNRH